MNHKKQAEELRRFPPYRLKGLRSV
uniref:Uncharacterized protein n=1 Tax=Anguilla anguilla TaxID=7936 RepID=A0A0E9V382_ANGAN